MPERDSLDSRRPWSESIGQRAASPDARSEPLCVLRSVAPTFRGAACVPKRSCRSIPRFGPKERHNFCEVTTLKVMNWTHLREVMVLSLVAMCAAAALEAKNHKAEKFFKDGQTAENKNDW